MSSVVSLLELIARRDSLRSERDGLNCKIRETEAAVIAACPHPLDQLREYRTKHTAPTRICMQCGLAEEGWGSGYQKLHKDWYGIPPLIDVLTYSETVTAYRSQDDMHGRKETQS